MGSWDVLGLAYVVTRLDHGSSWASTISWFMNFHTPRFLPIDSPHLPSQCAEKKFPRLAHTMCCKCLPILAHSMCCKCLPTLAHTMYCQCLPRLAHSMCCQLFPLLAQMQAVHGTVLVEYPYPSWLPQHLKEEASAATIEIGSTAFAQFSL